MEAFIWKRKKLNKNYQLTEFSKEAKTNSPTEMVWATVLATSMEWDLLTISMATSSTYCFLSPIAHKTAATAPALVSFIIFVWKKICFEIPMTTSYLHKL